MNTKGNLITAAELADFLKVHPSTIYRLLKRRAIPAFKIGKDWRFDLETIDRWRLSQRAEVDTSGRRSAPRSHPPR